jgi:hypothetical protein
MGYQSAVSCIQQVAKKRTPPFICFIVDGKVGTVGFKVTRGAGGGRYGFLQAPEDTRPYEGTERSPEGRCLQNLRNDHRNTDYIRQNLGPERSSRWATDKANLCGLLVTDLGQDLIVPAGNIASFLLDRAEDGAEAGSFRF